VGRPTRVVGEHQNWMIEASFVPADLDETIRRLQDHRDALAKKTDDAAASR